MSGKSRNAECLIYILIGVLMAFIYKRASVSPYNADGVFHGLNFNLVVYVASLAGAFLLFLILMGFLGRFQSTLTWADLGDPEAPGTRSMARRILYMIYIAVLICSVVLVYQIYVNENNLYPENTAATYLRQQVPHPLYFGVVAALSAILFLTVKRSERMSENRPLRYSLIPVFAFLNAVLVYCPNILEDKGAGSLHIHAVLNSIINVMHGTPYNDLNCSIYGHYGLFIAPLSFLFGNNLHGIMTALSVVAFIAFFAAFYAAMKLIRSNLVYVLTLMGVTGTTTLLTRRGQYFQVNPLRLVWPAITLAVIAYGISHTQTGRKWLVLILEFICGICSVAWNFETGLFCVLVIMAGRVYRALYTDPLFSRHTFRTIFGSIVYGALSFVLSFCLVGTYNLLSGGSFSTVKQFIYPLFSGTYNVNHLRTPLPSVTFLYFFQILLFFLTILILLRRQATHRDGDHITETVAFVSSLSGLFSLIYFMNRAAYGNMSISHIQMNLVLGYWASKAMEADFGKWQKQLAKPSSLLKTGILAVLFGCAFWLAAEGAMYFQVAAEYRVKSSWNMKSLEEAAASVSSQIPKDTFGFGTYVPELYEMLGWDTHCRMTDWSDMNDFNRSYAFEEAGQQNAVFTSEEWSDPSFTLISEIPVGSYTFRYYQKTS